MTVNAIGSVVIPSSSEDSTVVIILDGERVLININSQHFKGQLLYTLCQVCYFKLSGKRHTTLPYHLRCTTTFSAQMMLIPLMGESLKDSVDLRDEVKT